jgi:hypothetical protein
MTSKRERYLELKHERLANCGQCIGFRAKGIDLTDTVTKPVCAPAVDCHKSCPALGLGGGKTAQNQPSGGQRPIDQVTEQTQVVQPAEHTECYRCGVSEGD